MPATTGLNCYVGERRAPVGLFNSGQRQGTCPPLYVLVNDLK
jgi:hypothetical protein